MRHVLNGSLTLSFVLSLGCSTTGGGSAPDPGSSTGNGGVGNTGASGNNAGSGFVYHTGGLGQQQNTNGTAPPPDGGGCAGDVAQAQLTQVNILILLDKSGSMGIQNDPTAGSWDNCADRWNPVVDTLNQFFGQADSSRLYASLSFLPSDGNPTAKDSSGNPTIAGTICDPKSYTGAAGLKVALTELNDAGRKKFQDRLCDCASGVTAASTCIVPAGGTPTRPALQGTIEYAATVATNNPGSKTVIVLITDGMPSFYCGGSAPGGVCNSCDDVTNGCFANGTGCMDQPSEIDKITAVIQDESGTVGNNPKSIHIVGVGTDLNYSTAFDDWSNASGNDGIDLRNLTGSNAAGALLTSLQAIRSSSIQCSFKIPVPKDGSSIDPKATYVYYSSSATASGQYLIPTSDGTVNTCKTSENDFYFDNPNLPTTVTLCGTACNALQADSTGKIQVEYGCKQPQHIY